jgi:uncharacterized LabA/DUF88 family protein
LDSLLTVSVNKHYILCGSLHEASKEALSHIPKEYPVDRYAIFVDAGYFFVAGAQAAFDNHISRKQVALKSPAAMLADLCERASAVVDDLPLLRTYWYDAKYDATPGQRLSLDQSSLAMSHGVKLRLGTLNSAGEQKGVDSLIMTDLIDLARNRAIADAVVVTGDEDLRIAVQVAQSFGVRVHIFAAGDPSNNVSAALQMEADSVTVLDAAWFANHLELFSAVSAIAEPQVSPRVRFLRSRPLRRMSAAAEPQVLAVPAPVSAPIAGMAASNEISAAADRVIKEILETLPPEKLEQLAQALANSNFIPSEYDGFLIKKVSNALSGRFLSNTENSQIRGLFVRAVENHPGLAKTE